jgi:hypothetical protein
VVVALLLRSGQGPTVESNLRHCNRKVG